MPIAGIALFIAFSGYTWWRLDDLADRVGEARPGGRVRRVLVRQIGAMVGWWMIATGLAFVSLDGGPQITMPFFSLGLLLVALAVDAKRRGDRPVFWGAV